jgi:hypothetical protein
MASVNNIQMSKHHDKHTAATETPTVLQLPSSAILTLMNTLSDLDDLHEWPLVLLQLVDEYARSSQFILMGIRAFPRGMACHDCCSCCEK